ncbi:MULTISPECIES: magnesium transporter [unclassified Saccharicrinis]|uniref:magnesium transporter n=1 Tax=unclassified Saccharicrinis TaxID=2646859 RepID=UPI003D338EB3
METKEIKHTLINRFLQRFPSEAADVLNKASVSEILNYLKDQPIDIARRIFVKLDKAVSSASIIDMEDSFFVELFQGMDAYHAALILSRIGTEKTELKLRLLPDNLSKEINELMTYPSDSAGYLMDTKILTFNIENSVKDVLKKLRLLKDRKITSVYVINKEGQLAGKIPIQVIAISSPQELLSDLAEESKSVHIMDPREEIVEIFKDSNLFNLPVVDLDNNLLGVIRHDALVEATQQDATEDLQAMFGAGREERALSKVGFAVKKRLPWLEINLATAFLAAAVVGIYEDTIAQITVLAVFLPVVAGQSGNTGSQALAVTMRGLSLREIRPSQWLKVARKEATVGFVNGIAVALTTSVIVYFWASSFGLALIIAISMIFSMIIAGFSGAVIPIFLKSIGQDPAQSSSIVLTTVTDIVGFMSFLGLATALGSMLGIF